MYKEICRGISKKTQQVIEGHWADSNGVQAFVCKKTNSQWEEVEIFSLEFLINEKWEKVYEEANIPSHIKDVDSF